MSSVSFAILDFCSLISAQEGEPAGLRRRHKGLSVCTCLRFFRLRNPGAGVPLVW